MPLRFVFALHNHQPVGNFDGVFEGAYRDSYAPFLELLEQFPEIPISLHTSGCLMEWLVARKPDYLDRLKRLVGRGQVEIMGGGFYEPILAMIPSRDRVGQIRTYTAYLEKLFGVRIRGMWVPERVWEQNLVSDIAAAGIEYTVLDDYHFKQAGLEEENLVGYFLSEDNGRLVRIFPGSERMRYLVPFRNPEETVAYFGEVAGKNPNATIVFADDGEKFGSWPETYKHCYQDGWLRRFLEALRNNRHWVQFCTFAQALDAAPPAGKIYLPDCSYREMTEWSLPPPKLTAYNHLIHELDREQRAPAIKRFLRGGYWRNFKVKYPETEEMYCRMLQVSAKYDLFNKGEESGHSSFYLNASSLQKARQELYRAQCNCAWWHGAFGGLYLPHLRNAVYQHLIAADNALLEAEERGQLWIDVQASDLNLDGAEEVCLGNSRLAAYLNPQRGGTLYELDLRVIQHNLLATLARRPEAYHETILHHADGSQSRDGAQSIHDRVVFKQAGLDKLLQYDRYPRKSLIDHFFDAKVTLADLAATRETELGDFVAGQYEHQVREENGGAKVILSRRGQAAGKPVAITKEVSLQAGSDNLVIRYVLTDVPGPLHFAVELNFAGMAAGAEDRYFYHAGQPRAGQLQTLQDLADADRIGLVDEWLGLEVNLSLSRRGGIWAFPIQTVSQSEGGFELVHQSSAVLPHWRIEPDGQGRWEVTMELKLDVSRAEKRTLAAATA